MKRSHSVLLAIFFSGTAMEAVVALNTMKTNIEIYWIEPTVATKEFAAYMHYIYIYIRMKWWKNIEKKQMKPTLNGKNFFKESA